MLKRITGTCSLIAVACSLFLSAFTFADTPAMVEVPAGELVPALKALAKQSDVELLYQPEQLRDLRTEGVKGNYSAREAVAILIRGTALRVYTNERGVMVIAPVEKTSWSAEEKKLRLAQGDESSDKVAMKSVQSNDGESDLNKESTASHSLQEIIVTAQKRDQRLQDVPSSVVVLSAKQMEDLGLTQLSDYAKITPGLRIVGASTPGLGQPVIRGISSPGDRNPLVGIYLDDVPFTTSSPRFQGTNFNFDADLADIERIEVLKGPQSTLYGASTMGGLIKYVSKKPDPSAFAASAYLGGSRLQDNGSGSQARLWVNVPITDRIAMTAAAFHRSEPGYVTNTYTGEDNRGDATVKGVKGSLRIGFTENLTTTFSGFFQSIDTDGSAITFLDRATIRPAGQEPFYSTAIDLYNALDYSMVANNTSFELPFATITNIASYSEFSQDSLEEISALRFEAPFAGWIFDRSSKRYNDELRIASKPGRLEWMLGGYYTYEDTVVTYPVRGMGVDGNIVPTDHPAFAIYNYRTTGTYKEFAAFANVTFHLTERLEATGGIRYTPIDSSYTLVTSGRLGTNDLADEVSDSSTDYLATISYKPTSDLSFYVRAASAFRPGGPNALSVLAISVGVPESFEADKLWNYEVGVKGSLLDDAIDFSAAAYQMVWDNIQVTSSFSTNIGGTTANFSYVGNAAKAKSDGVELGVSIDPAEGLTIGLNSSYNKARITTPAGFAARPGDPLPNSPKWTGSLVADYSKPLSTQLTATAGLTFAHVGSLYSGLVSSPATVKLPAYETLDLRAGLKWSRYKLTARVANVTNERAVLSANSVSWNGSPFAGFIIRPRTFALALGAEF